MGFCNYSMFCYALLYVHSTFAIILMEKIELVALLSLSSWYALLYVHSTFAIILMEKRELVALLRVSSWCLVIVVWVFLAVS